MSFLTLIMITGSPLNGGEFVAGQFEIKCHLGVGSRIDDTTYGGHNQQIKCHLGVGARI